MIGESSNNLSIFCNEKLTFEEQIEFSSKNVKTSNQLFNKETIQKNENVSEKKTKNTLDYFLSKSSSNQISNIPTSNNSTSSRNAKINNYFQITGDLSVENLQKQIITWKEKCDRLEIEKERAVKDYNEKKRLYDKEIDKLMEENSETKENLMSLSTQKEQTEDQLKVTQKSLVKYLRELEETRRKERKKWLHEVGYRVYRQGTQRMTAAKVVDMWEDGEEIISVKKRLLEIIQEKNQLEKELNKNRKNAQVKENSDANKPNERYEQDDKIMLILYRINKLQQVNFIII
jgi:hypothetical protein